MPDVTITQANVRHISGPTSQGIAGATISRGQALALNSTNGRYVLADASDATLSKFVGIALTDGYNGADVLFATRGARVDCGGALTSAQFYVLSATAGGIAPVTDLSTNDYAVILGMGEGSRELTLVSGVVEGIQVP